jgi:phosphomethylpyrimidine synthase
MRTEWVSKRREHENVSQMHYARQGVVTEEMHYVSHREGLPADLVREEVARGRMIIPANVNHTSLEPMAIGIASKCKVNANIGASPNSSNLDEELAKLHLAVQYGADTVMDLSTGGQFRCHPYRYHTGFIRTHWHCTNLSSFRKCSWQSGKTHR